MSAWHMRLWRRVKLAPGLTVNLSKSGPSLSVGPRGAKVTFGRRGIRQTVGISGTGIYATRTLASSSASASRSAGASTAMAGVEPNVAAVASPDTEPTASFELHFGLALMVGAVLTALLALGGVDAGGSIITGALAVAAGLVYEAFGHHHPAAAKVLAQLVVGALTLVIVIAGVLAVAVLGAALAGLSSGSGRHGTRR